LIWFGKSIEKACRDVTVLGRVTFSELASDLGVVVDRELSLAAPVTAVCRAGYKHLSHLRPVDRTLSAHATRTLVRALLVSPGLLQLTAVRHQRRATSTPVLLLLLLLLLKSVEFDDDVACY